MKTYIKNLFLCHGIASRGAWACLGVASMGSRILPALLIGLALLPLGRVTAQTFTTHAFADGYLVESLGGLTLAGNTLYGTTEHTVFAVNTDGNGFTTLHAFTGGDGIYPQAGLVLSGNTLYGTAESGGNTVTNSVSFSSAGNGAIFAIDTHGANFSVLHYFTAIDFSSSNPSTYTNGDGAYPSGPLILAGDTLYGAASGGGSTGNGTVFAVNKDGTGFRNLHSFTTETYISLIDTYTNSDGANPAGSLILSGDTLYGTASRGGSGGVGTVFAINTNGTSFTVLHDFAAVTFFHTNSDGANPAAGLIISGNTLYGTASQGGAGSFGTVFAVNTNGSGLTNLHSFDGYTDGANPVAGLVLLGNTLYGGLSGGSSGLGTVFAVKTDGSGFTNLHTFDGYDGSDPVAGLVLSGNTLYGTTQTHGSGESSMSNPPGGSVFSISFTPQLSISPSAANVVLRWPTNVAGFDYSGFTVQSTTNLTVTNAWTTLTNLPVTVVSQSQVTDAISGPAKFYRLKK